ncbi:MAG TPA: hypothetical protein VLM89_14470, partial [Phycisphaerae bacterium]|nr:hypothetical protein [Phycisphaerae bacterium]
GLAYHVMNRVAGRQELFEDAADYAAFERVLAEAGEREPAAERAGVGAGTGQRASGRPYGGEPWVSRTAAKLGLESTLRPVGRPKKPREA